MRKLALIARPWPWRPASRQRSPAPRPTEINFGIISTEASANQKKNWEPFLEAMSKATGSRSTASTPPTMPASSKRCASTRCRSPGIGNKSAMEAVDRANGEVFAQIVAKDGSTGYYSHIIVTSDSPYHEARGHPEMRQVARFRHRRSELDLGLPGADLLYLRGQEHRSEDLLQDRAQRQPSGQRAWRSPTSRSMPRPTTAKTCSASESPRPRPARRSRSSGPRRSSRSIRWSGARISTRPSRPSSTPS